jgi:hypothetical protein
MGWTVDTTASGDDVKAALQPLRAGCQVGNQLGKPFELLSGHAIDGTDTPGAHLRSHTAFAPHSPRRAARHRRRVSPG